MFGGVEVGPLELQTILKEALQYMKDIPYCQESKLNLLKVLLLGQEVSHTKNIYMWRTNIFTSKEDFYGAVNADLQQVMTLSCVSCHDTLPFVQATAWYCIVHACAVAYLAYSPGLQKQCLGEANGASGSCLVHMQYNAMCKQVWTCTSWS